MNSVQSPLSLTMLYSTKTLHSIYKRVHFLSSKYQKLVRAMIFNINFVLHLFASSQLVSLAEWVWQHCDDLISRISAYHMQLCTFSILQDTNSQDWSNNKPFYEVNQCMYNCTNNVDNTIAIPPGQKNILSYSNVAFTYSWVES